MSQIISEGFLAKISVQTSPKMPQKKILSKKFLKHPATATKKSQASLCSTTTAHSKPSTPPLSNIVRTNTKAQIKKSKRNDDNSAKKTISANISPHTKLTHTKKSQAIKT